MHICYIDFKNILAKSHDEEPQVAVSSDDLQDLKVFRTFVEKYPGFFFFFLLSTLFNHWLQITS